MSIFPTKILLAMDGSKEATLAAKTAIDLAEKTGSELHVVHVRVPLHYPLYYEGYYEGFDIEEQYPQEEQKIQEELERRAQGLLNQQVRKIKNEGGFVTQAHLRIGRPDAEIVTLAEEMEAGLIVIGSRGLEGIRRALMGSVSDSVVHHAHCPVLVVRQERQYSGLR